MFEFLAAVNRAHEKYTYPSHGPPVRSASIAVLSWKTPRRPGADEPLATTVVPRNFFPSFEVGRPSGPAVFSKRATQTSPKVFAVPAGSPELSEPMKTRPWLSHAITGSPAPDVRTCASCAYGDGSPGYPGTSELWKLRPQSSER